MVSKGRISVLLLFVVALFLSSASFSLAREDPELKQCKHQCQKEGRKEHCERRCEEYYREKQERQRGRGERGTEDDGSVVENTKFNQGRREQRECERCEERRREQERESRREQERESRREQEREREREEFGWKRRQEEEEEEEEEEGGEGERNSYVFQLEDFRTVGRTQHGRMRVLPKFTESSKKLFKGIENNRVEIFEADPHTFVAPVHCDAEYLLFVANGRGTVTLVSPEGRESFNVERGHIMRIPAGETVYMINRDNDEKLILVKLIRPVSTPGHFESFFPAGGENPETFFKAFRTETLEAIFKISRDRLEKVLGRQGDGFIKRASREQIRALSQQQEGGGRWPFGGGGSKREEAAPFNIYEKRPRHHNQFGKLIEAKVEECEQLRELDVSISFANISQGAMHVPYYNSKSTKISVVVGGKGNFEMACPHTAGHRGGERERGEHGSPVQYRRITGELRSGTVFVVPAGHPFVAMASKNDNLEVICFELNAENNQKVALAGKNNIMRHFEREAKELSFSAPAEEVDTFLESNDAEFFFRGPRQPHEGRAAA